MTNQTHLKTKTYADVERTLNSFAVGDSELILFVNSNYDTLSWSSRYNTLKKLDKVKGRFKFNRIDAPQGTVITRMED